MTTMPARKTMSEKAADVVLLHKHLGTDVKGVRDIIRDWIKGLSPEEADAAIVELFREVEVCQKMMWEEIIDGPLPDEWEG
jgi:hypothetical protein